MEEDSNFYSEQLDRLVKLEDNPADGNWTYGLVFQAHPRTIMKVITETLGELNTVKFRIFIYLIMFLVKDFCGQIARLQNKMLP